MAAKGIRFPRRWYGGMISANLEIIWAMSDSTGYGCTALVRACVAQLTAQRGQAVQDKYVGDIGDYAKFSLLRALSCDRRLGLSWYLFPDEGNNDGRHIDYLGQHTKWRHFDEQTFETLKDIVSTGKRCVSEIEQSDLLPDATVFWSCRLDFQGCARSDQKEWRNNWFMNSLERLKDCDLVFADPDNGIKRRETFRPGQRKHAKSIPECEARTLADGGRPVVIYHHNTRYRCGHDAEIRHWQKRLGEKTCAVRWRHRSPRTFFILNCTDRLAQRAEQWCEKWESPNVCFENALAGNSTGIKLERKGC